MYIAIAVAAVLFAADRVLKYLSRTGKLKFESKHLRLTHLENRGFFLGLGQKHEKLLRWLPLGVWLLAAVCLLPQLCKRAFTAQLGIATVLLGGIDRQSREKSSQGLPFIARVPVLKWIFGTHKNNKQERRLNVFIKPTVVE